MGNFVKRSIAFILGMVFMLVTVFGGIAGGLYFLFKKKAIIGQENAVFGDLGSFTAEQWAALIIESQKDPAGLDFAKLEQYGFNTEEMLKSFGVNVSNMDPRDLQAVKSIAPLSLFSANGFDELSLGVVFAFMPKNADGKYPLFSEYARNLLRDKSVGKIFGKNENGVSNFYTELRGFKVGAILSSSYEEIYNPTTKELEYTNSNSGLETLGNINLSFLFDSSITGKPTNIGAELHGGELASIGEKQIKSFIASLMATSEEDVKQAESNLSILGDVLIKDLFPEGEEGSYAFSANPILENLTFSKLYKVEQCTKDENCSIHTDILSCDGKWYQEGENGYTLYNDKGIEGDIMKNLFKLNVLELLGGLSVSSLLEGAYLGTAFGYAIDQNVVNGFCLETCENAEEGHEHNYRWLDSGNNYVGNFFNELANISLETAVTDGFDINSIINDATIGEVFGYVFKDGIWYKNDGVTPVPRETTTEKTLYNLYDKTVGDLSNGNFELKELVEGLSLGDMVSAVKSETTKDGYCLPSCENTEEGHTHNYYWLDGENNFVGLAYNKLYNLSMQEVMTDSTLIKTTLEDMMIGELLGYNYNESKDEWYSGDTPVLSENVMDKIMEKIYSKTITNFKTLDAISLVEGMCLGEFLNFTKDENGVWFSKDNEKASPLNQRISSVLISELIEGTINIEDVVAEMYVGEIMGYTREPHEGYCSLECEIPVDEHHSHEFYWLKNGEQVTGLDSFVSNMYMREILDGKVNYQERISHLKLGQVLVITSESPIILQLLKDTKIEENQLNDKVDGLYLGEVMGHYYNVDDGKWYTDKTLSTPVDGINGKISTYTIEEVSSVGFNPSDFTLGDVMSAEDLSKGAFKIIDISDDGGDDYNVAYSSVSEVPINEIASRVTNGVKKASYKNLSTNGIINFNEDTETGITNLFTTMIGKSFIDNPTDVNGEYYKYVAYCNANGLTAVEDSMPLTTSVKHYWSSFDMTTLMSKIINFAMSIA